MSENTSLAVQVAETRRWLEDEARQSELAKVLPRGLSPAAFTRIVMTQYLKAPKLAECSRESMWIAVMESAQLGLALDGVMAALVPYKSRAQLIVMFQGLAQLAFRHPRVVALHATCVREKDHLEYEEGLRPKIIHRPAMPPAGEIVAAYATARITGGGLPFKFMWREELEQHRARSHNAETVWLEWYQAMAEKTAFRQLSKLIPKSPELIHALAVDADPETEAPPGSPPLPHGTTVLEALDAIGETAG